MHRRAFTLAAVKIWDSNLLPATIIGPATDLVWCIRRGPGEPEDNNQSFLHIPYLNFDPGTGAVFALLSIKESINGRMQIHTNGQRMDNHLRRIEKPTLATVEDPKPQTPKTPMTNSQTQPQNPHIRATTQPSPTATRSATTSPNHNSLRTKVCPPPPAPCPPLKPLPRHRSQSRHQICYLHLTSPSQVVAERSLAKDWIPLVDTGIYKKDLDHNRRPLPLLLRDSYLPLTSPSQIVVERGLARKWVRFIDIDICSKI